MEQLFRKHRPFSGCLSWRTAGEDCSVIAKVSISAATASLPTEVRLSGGRFLYQSLAKGVAELRISVESVDGPSLLGLVLRGWTSPPTTLTPWLWTFPGQPRRGVTASLRWVAGHRRRVALTISEAERVARFTLEVGKVGSCAGCTRKGSN